MTLSTQPVVVPEAGEVIESVSLWSEDERSRDSSNYHIIRVGFRTGSRLTWIGQWDQRSNGAPQGEAISLTGSQPLNARPSVGDVCVVQIETSGTPTAVDGICLTWRLARVGQLRKSPEARGTMVHRADAVDPLVGVGHQIEDAATRTAVEALAQHANTTLRPVRLAPVWLTGGTQVSTTELYGFDAFDHHGSTTISGAAAQVGSATITLTPGQAGTHLAVVTCSFTWEASSAAASVLTAYIRNTTDSVTHPAILIEDATADLQTGTVMSIEEVEQATTYEFWAGRVSGVNGTIYDKVMTGYVIKKDAREVP